MTTTDKLKQAEEIVRTTTSPYLRRDMIKYLKRHGRPPKRPRNKT